ncbi:aldo/keto reductase [Sinomonas sp. JGH33]|uniref:Aldo/keto reductase n=1 Tax=Sinomonas terricola TaxID=3110330 RepID=A0ABU5T1M0_9MICC|nr:aldo/keto reductase [Sinomonas sp. JGH33]MEA5453389.1 aldo/keto reductase [Sinomonas sp. JGH33]
MSRLLTPSRLGGFEATPLGIGTARLGAFWQRRLPGDGLRALETALDLGITLIDTADVYARGIAERLVGRAVRGRDDVVVVTKVGLLKTPAGLAAAARFGDRAPTGSGLSMNSTAGTCFASRYVEEAAQRCLRRQGRSVLDVLLLHEPTADDLRGARFGEAMERMADGGTIRCWGASVRTLDAAVAALDLPGLAWLEIPANLAAPEIAAAVAQHPRSQEVVVVALGVLGDGSLVREASRCGLHGADGVAALTEAAAALPGIDGVLLGMSSRQHAVDNLGAIHRGLPEGDLAHATAILRDRVAG